ncbi:MAG: hypothetical protein Q9203_001916 [Teloschistes exilis]
MSLSPLTNTLAHSASTVLLRLGARTRKHGVSVPTAVLQSPVLVARRALLKRIGIVDALWLSPTTLHLPRIE